MAAVGLVLAAVLTCVAGLAEHRDNDNEPHVNPNPTQYSSKTNTIEEKKHIAEEGCSHVIIHTMCHKFCLYKSFGAIDKEGRYVQIGAADIVRVFAKDMLQANRPAMQEALRLCNSMNTNLVEGCDMAGEVDICIQREYYKIHYKDKIEKEFRKVKTRPVQ